MYDYSNVSKDSLELELNTSIDKCKNLIEEIKQKEVVVLENFDEFERQVAEVTGKVAFLSNVHPQKEIRDFGNEAESILENYILDTITDEKLFEQFKKIDTTKFNHESLKYFKSLERDFLDAGHNLDKPSKGRLIEIEKKLIELEISFSKNIADDKSKVLLSLEQLDGLSVEEISNFNKSEEKYVITMAYPDINAVLENCINRSTREVVWKTFNNRAVNTNSSILKEAVVLRNEKANLFGFATWAEYRLQHRMAKNPKNVNQMYSNLIPKLQQSAQNEKEELASDGIEASSIAPWDIRYFITKKRNEVSTVDNSEIKKYFFIHDVKKEMFSICEEVFSIEIKQENSDTAWHEDVELWSIWDQGEELLGYFYLDLHPRDGKYTHAAVMDVSPGNEQKAQLPICSMVANFPNPKIGDGLMTFDEVETLFHEFGHVLHMAIGKSKFSRFIGASVEWDFVEAPSQIMEHWVWKSQCMKRISKHIETGESLEDSICKKLNDSKNIGISLLTLRQVSFGLADQHLHGENFNDSLLDIEKSAQSVTTIDYPTDINHLASFGHLLGGYDAAYYGYLWADIIGDDLFSRFENEGVLSNTVGVDYKNKILSPGGTKSAEELVENFLGRKWNDQAFLLQKNLLN